jgi:hypothetical protein
MRSILAGRRRAVLLTFAALIAVLAGLVTLSVGRGSAHASDAGHDHGSNATGR